jgi:hypothetical protein
MIDTPPGAGLLPDLAVFVYERFFWGRPAAVKAVDVIYNVNYTTTYGNT